MTLAYDTEARWPAAPRQRKPQSLFRFLTGRGGLQPHGDLRYILDGKHGWMIRRKGMTLDRAREACVEAGYLQDAGWDSDRESDSTINDLLELIGAEARGFKQYPFGHCPADECGEDVGAPSPCHRRSTQAREDTGGATMTSEQYRKAIDKLGLSVVGAGRMLGISQRQAQRFASGETPVPEPVAKLLRLMVRLNLSPADLK